MENVNQCQFMAHVKVSVGGAKLFQIDTTLFWTPCGKWVVYFSSFSDVFWTASPCGLHITLVWVTLQLPRFSKNCALRPPSDGCQCCDRGISAQGTVWDRKKQSLYLRHTVFSERHKLLRQNKQFE